MIYSATKESVIISVLSQANFAALAASECSQIFDSGRKYPDTCSSEYLYDHLKKLNWVYRRRKKKSICQSRTMSIEKSTMPSTATKCQPLKARVMASKLLLLIWSTLHVLSIAKLFTPPSTLA